MTDANEPNLAEEIQKADRDPREEIMLQDTVEFEQELKKSLREKGKLLGLNFAPNTSVQRMIEELTAAREIYTNMVPEAQGEGETEDEYAMRRRLKLENTKLVRIQISCLNPQKSDLPGEIFTVHNEYVGTVKKFIPYNEAGNAYHVPMFLLKFLKDKKFMQIIQPPKGSTAPPSTRLVNEFAINILPDLTEQELRELARAQGAAQSAEDE